MSKGGQTSGIKRYNKVDNYKNKSKKLNELYVGLWKACGWAGRSCRLLCSLFLTVLQIAMFCIIYTKAEFFFYSQLMLLFVSSYPYNISIYFVLNSTNRKSPCFFFSFLHEDSNLNIEVILI